MGRTGTIILCDICLRMAATENKIDVLYYLHRLRSQRSSMVDNPEQYKLVHLILLEMLLAPQTSMTYNNDMDKHIKKLTQTQTLKEHIQYINRTAWCDSAAKTVVNGDCLQYFSYCLEKIDFKIFYQVSNVDN